MGMLNYWTLRVTTKNCRCLWQNNVNRLEGINFEQAVLDREQRP